MSFQNAFTSVNNSIKANAQALAMHSTNIAQSSVNGSRGQKITFATILGKELRPAQASTFGFQGMQDPMQFSGGAYVSSLSYNFETRGEKVAGSDLDLFIENLSALFVVSDSFSQIKRYTKVGQITEDYQHNLRSGQSLLLGYNYDQSGQRGSALTPINTHGLRSLQWDSNGILSGMDPNNIRRPIAQVALTSFPNMRGLTSSDGGLTFTESASSGKAFIEDVPGLQFGLVTPKFYETSNIDNMEEVLKGSAPTERNLEAMYSAIQSLLSMTDNFLKTVVG